MRVADKVALITGSGKGIGGGIAERLAQDGADIVVVDIDMNLAEAMAEKIRGMGRRSLAIKCDVSKLDQVQKMVDDTIAAMGRIDILVNNAGIFRDKSIFRMTEEDFDLVLNVNLKGAWNLIKAVVPSMRERRYGKILNISSRAMLGNPGQSNYSASKAGLVGMTRALALELGKFNINCNAIAPGAVMTDLLQAAGQELIDKMAAATPLQRLGEPSDIANAVLFFVSDEASYITGQTLLVCGGRSLYSANL